MGLSIDGTEFSERALLQEPVLAQQIAYVIAKFALIEGVMGGVYGLLKNQEIEQALDELKQLPTNSKRVAAVRAILDTRFQGDALSEADNIAKAVLKFAEDRNKLAHGVWGINSDTPGVLYWLPVKKLIPFTASIISAGTKGTVVEAADQLSTFIEQYTSTELSALELAGDNVLDAAFKLYNAAGALAAKADGWESVAT